MLLRSSWPRSKSWAGKRAPPLAEPWLMGLIMTTFSLYPELYPLSSANRTAFGYRPPTTSFRYNQNCYYLAENGDRQLRPVSRLQLHLGSGFVRFVLSPK